MHLTPRALDKLVLHGAVPVAQVVHGVGVGEIARRVLGALGQAS
jgi:hypothetical protein